MAVATAVLTENAFPLGTDATQRRVRKFGTVAISASPATYATGGLAISFASPVMDESSQTPILAYFESVSGSGYIYGWNQANNKLQIFSGAAAQSPLTELTNAETIPAAVSGDSVAYEVHFLKNA